MTSTPFMTSVRFVKLARPAPVALTVAACSGPAEKGFVQADANTIRQRTQEFETAFNTKDAVKVATFYPGEGVVMPPNAPTIRGREEIQKFYVDLYAQGGTDLEMEHQGRERPRHAGLRYRQLLAEPPSGKRAPPCATAANTCSSAQYRRSMDHRVEHLEQRPARDAAARQLVSNRGASPLGLPYTRSRAPLAPARSDRVAHSLSLVRAARG